MIIEFEFFPLFLLLIPVYIVLGLIVFQRKKVLLWVSYSLFFLTSLPLAILSIGTSLHLLAGCVATGTTSSGFGPVIVTCAQEVVTPIVTALTFGDHLFVISIIGMYASYASLVAGIILLSLLANSRK